MTNTTAAPTVTLEWFDVVALMKALSDDRDHWAKLARIGGNADCTPFIARRLADKADARMKAVRDLWAAADNGATFTLAVTPEVTA